MRNGRCQVAARHARRSCEAVVEMGKRWGQCDETSDVKLCRKQCKLEKISLIVLVLVVRDQLVSMRVHLRLDGHFLFIYSRACACIARQENKLPRGWI